MNRSASDRGARAAARADYGIYTVGKQRAAPPEACCPDVAASAQPALFKKIKGSQSKQIFLREDKLTAE